MHDGGVQLDDPVGVGEPPRPTELSDGSSSTMRTPARRRRRGRTLLQKLQRRATACLPFAEAMETGRRPPVAAGFSGCGWAPAAPAADREAIETVEAARKSRREYVLMSTGITRERLAFSQDRVSGSPT